MEDFLQPLSDFLRDGDFSSEVAGFSLVASMAIYYWLLKFTEKSRKEKVDENRKERYVADLQRLSRNNTRDEKVFLDAIDKIDKMD